MARHGTACWHGTARHDMARHGAGWRGMARHSTAWHGTSWHGTARDGAAWHGTSWHGAAWTSLTSAMRDDVTLFLLEARRLLLLAPPAPPSSSPGPGTSKLNELNLDALGAPPSRDMATPYARRWRQAGTTVELSQSSSPRRELHPPSSPVMHALAAGRQRASSESVARA